VLLCDDHQLFREGAKRILADQDDMAVVADVSTLEEGIPLARSLKPTVVVLDIAFPSGRSGLDAISEFKDAAPDTRVLMVSMHHDRSFGRAAFERGASGYVTKDAAADDLTNAVRIVGLGGQYVPKFLERSSESADLRLTLREHDVLALLALGHTSAEMADHLYLSVRTVESYRSHLFRKFGAASRAELIRAAKQRGLL
jgi:two-component system response regulator NreC